MKGGIDRVLVNTVIYATGKHFETGRQSEKRTMVCLSTGGFATML